MEGLGSNDCQVGNAGGIVLQSTLQVLFIR